MAKNKKKFYKSAKESRTDYRGNALMYDEYYAGMDPRRRQEMADANMISEDNKAVANLPQNVIMREYPKARFGGYSELNDTLMGIDIQMNDDDKEMKKMRFPEKY